MGKPIEFSDIHFKGFGVRPGVRPLKRELIVRGFDTETGLDGNITVMACDDGSFEYGEPIGDVLKFLTNPKYYHSFNFFYNLGFDHNAVFRSVLSEKQFNDLIYAGRTRHGKYRIEYIPGKLLKIVRSCKSWKYYDISKFYKGGFSGKLVDVYKTVFGKEYKKILDASIGFADIDDEVVKYCIEDAKACQELAENLVIPANRIVPMHHWHSGATLAKALRKQNLTRPYFFKKNSRLQQFALYAYGGARIEVFKRGGWGYENNEKLYMYDIRSAYPSIQWQLDEVRQSVTSKEPKYYPESLHSFFLISLNIDDVLIGPLKYKHRDVVFYPIGVMSEVWVDKNELELLMEYDIRFKILKAAHDLSRPEEKPYEYLKDLYYERLKCKRSDKPEIKQLEFPYKLALNSSYGMLIERIQKHRFDRKFTPTMQENGDSYCYRDYTGKVILVSPEYHSGQFFNPVHACEVTSAIRCKLYRDSFKHQENLVKFATDSITFDKKVKLDFGEKLGQYEDSPPYSGIVIGSGVYSMRSETKRINKFRSFDRIDLLKVAEENGTKPMIEFVRKAPIKLKEAKKERFRWFNTFQEKRKKLDINFDHRRIWHPNALKNLKVLMQDVYDSEPLNAAFI